MDIWKGPELVFCGDNTGNNGVITYAGGLFWYAEESPAGVRISAAHHPHIGWAFDPFKNSFQEASILTIFHGAKFKMLGLSITCLLVEQVGLDIPDLSVSSL